MNGRRGVSNLSIERSRQYLLERVINDSLQALKTLFAQSFALLWASGCWLEASVVAVARDVYTLGPPPPCIQ